MSEWDMTDEQKRALNRHAPFMANSGVVRAAVRLGIVIPAPTPLSGLESSASRNGSEADSGGSPTQTPEKQQ